MIGTLKHKGLIWCVILSSFLVSCISEDKKEAKKEKWHEVTGETQGTTYKIALDDIDRKISKKEIDSILCNFDLSLSTYIDNSVVSVINASQDSIHVLDSSRYFAKCYIMSRKIYELTNGAFDPSVYPLVKAWGFYGDELWVQSDADVSEILKSVGFEDRKHHELNPINLFELEFLKFNQNFKLDFNAIAQGLSVDVLADYLEEHGIKNYFVEIGGEIRVKGKNTKNGLWRIGVDSPNQEEGMRVIENIVHISDKAVATSGNYRKFYVKDGVKYAHTINPKTGKPVQHSLLSATVIANNCAEADAYATAFMVMGVEKSMQFITEHPELGLEIYLLHDEGNGKLQRSMSPGFKTYLK